jgi:hypothetical protein
LVEPPCVTDWLAGVAPIVKLGGGLTTSDTFVVWVRLPLVPVIVSVDVPVGVLAAVFTFNVEELPAGLGVKLAVAPVGRPLTLNVTWPPNPPDGVTVIV